MSTSSYKVVTKVNVTLQVQVKSFHGTHTLDDIKKLASEEAIEVVARAVKESEDRAKLTICRDVDVFSIMVKEEVKP